MFGTSTQFFKLKKKKHEFITYRDIEIDKPLDLDRVK